MLLTLALLHAVVRMQRPGKARQGKCIMHLLKWTKRKIELKTFVQTLFFIFSWTWYDVVELVGARIATPAHSTN